MVSFTTTRTNISLLFVSQVMPIQFNEPQLKIDMASNLPESPMGEDFSLSRESRRHPKFGVM